MELIEKFKYLPDEIIHTIINYTDVIVNRHGKYINRIKKQIIGIIYLEEVYIDQYILVQELYYDYIII